jgi:hypothetical protein
MRTALFVILLLGHVWLTPGKAAEYAVAHTATPVLHTPDFEAVFGGPTGHELKTDHCGQARELEYIALPGTVFRLQKQLHRGTTVVYQIETDEYPAPPNVQLYVDSRFVNLEHTVPAVRASKKPPIGEIVTTLRASVGSAYVWGGNALGGVPELAAWFYKKNKAPVKAKLTLTGLDCSGLLYYATKGLTPRNTSQLITYGQGVRIAGRTAEDIAALLQPLDLIVWNGHVVIVLDRLNAIESRLKCGKPGNGGVVISPLTQRISEIMRTRRPADAAPDGNSFVIRRWYDSPEIDLYYPATRAIRPLPARQLQPDVIP